MMKAPVVQTVNLTFKFGKRVLFQDLNLCLDRERVALVARNGAGKSTLLRLLAGDLSVNEKSVFRRGHLHYVPQLTSPEGGSPGEFRRGLLRDALDSGAELLLLDEPTQDLDQRSVDWLVEELREWKGGLLVATHDSRVLGEFRHFFLIEESGCRCLSGSFEELQDVLECEYRKQETRYLKRLNTLAKEEEHKLHSARRRRRKKQFGRSRELDRATPRGTLNQKRDYAQVKHGRINAARQKRLEELRGVTKAARRALRVELPLQISMPELPDGQSSPIIVAEELSKSGLWDVLSMQFSRERLALTGPNGSGKTTLLETLIGQRKAEAGRVRCNRSRLGFIAQSAQNWMLRESLLEILGAELRADERFEHLVAHRFPLALAQRPLKSLSPGERVRAALIGLLSRTPVPEALVLDEPLQNLDVLGQTALLEALRVWPGGLIIATHNRDCLSTVGFQRVIELGVR